MKWARGTIKGREAEEFVQRKLWAYGYSVTRAGLLSGYDLLIGDGGIAVEVKSSYANKSGSYNFAFNNGWVYPSWPRPGSKAQPFNVVALVFRDLLGMDVRFITYEQAYQFTKVPGARRNKQAIRISAEIAGKLHKSPYDVIGRPVKK